MGAGEEPPPLPAEAPPPLPAETDPPPLPDDDDDDDDDDAAAAAAADEPPVPAHAAPAAAEAPALPAEAAPPLPQDTPSASAGSAGGWQQIEDAGAGPSSSVGAGPSSSAGPSGSAANGDASSHKPPESVEAIEAKATGEEAALLKTFFNDMRDVDRDNEVNRVLWSFKLNPYERLNLRFTATPEEVRRQYRKLSLMVHPDKCKHAQAAEAFDILGAAQKELLDEGKREELWKVLEMARDEVRKERAKETKHDTTIELAAILHEKGKEGVQEQYEQTDEFHERWRLKARDMLARTAWRRQKLAKRLKEETERAKEEHEDMVQAHKKQREHEKKWESTRDTRVGTWREYMKQGSKKKSSGHIKPPKQKTFDEDKTYVQRPVGEQHRPPPPKPAGPKK